MISGVVEKLRIIQTFRWLGRPLLVGLDSRRCRRAVLNKITERYNHDDPDERELEFFHSLGLHWLFCYRLPALDLPDLQVHDQRKKEDENQRNRESFASET